jgi:hypothetical protein
VRARLTRGGRGVVHFSGSDGADFGPTWLEEATISERHLELNRVAGPMERIAKLATQCRRI